MGKQGMDKDQARDLLGRYADGTLTPEESEAIKLLLAQEPRLEEELHRIRQEDLLLAEALAPLRPNRSARIRLADHMKDVHARAQAMANSWPQRFWSYFRLVFGYTAIVVAGVLAWFFALPGSPILLAASGITFVVGLLFMLVGRDLVRLEARVMSYIGGREIKPTHLEALTLELFGFCCILLAAVMYIWRIW